MADVLAPAIGYAENGFPVTELIAYYLQASARRFADYPNFRETYLPGGKAPEKGEVFRNPALANTYRQLAQNGRDVFYKGKMAAAIAGFLREQGGFLSEADLAAHQSEWVEPLSVNYRGYDIWELPPNGQGIAALQMLNILEGFDFQPADFGTARHIHLFSETKKLVYEDRARYYADPNFAKIPLQQLLDKNYAAQRRARIQPDRAANRVEAGTLSAPNTIYLTVADREGNMISLIQSNFRGMGSGMVPPGLGFMLQDRGELFSLDPAHANAFAPGKRPFHTIIPAFITKDGAPFLCFGVMGGDFQPLGHVQIIQNIIDFGMNIQEAGDAPRIDHSGGNSEPTGPASGGGGGRGQILLESGVPYETVRQLLQMGHQVGYGLGGYGGYQAIRWDPVKKVYYGASESRKDGCAIGY